MHAYRLDHPAPLAAVPPQTLPTRRPTVTAPVAVHPPMQYVSNVRPRTAAEITGGRRTSA
jgi:hypothetical protein